MTSHEQASAQANAYNHAHQLTSLVWSRVETVWEMWHQGSKTRQSYSDAELLPVGYRLGWGGKGL